MKFLFLCTGNSCRSILSEERFPVEFPQEARRIEPPGHLAFVYLFYDQRDAEHHRRAYLPERGQQVGCRRRSVYVHHRSAAHERQQHAERTFVGVGEGEYRKEDVVRLHEKQVAVHLYLCREIVVREHDALGRRGRSRCVDYHRQVFRFRFGHGPEFERSAGDDTEVLGAYHDVHPFHHLLGDARVELVGYEKRFGFGMGDYHVQLAAGEIGQYRNGDHAGGDDGEITDAPVGHVAAQQRHFVAAADASSEQDTAHVLHPVVEIVVRHGFAFEHRERRPVAVGLDAVGI